MTSRSSTYFVLALAAGYVACEAAQRKDPEAPPSMIAAPQTATAQSDPSAIASSPLAASADATSAPVTTVTGARPLYYDRPLTDADLKGRTLRELSLLRNTIYARAGNTFRRPWLDEHFRAQPWYRPGASIDESKITDTDRANAQKIADADASISQKELEQRRDEVLARRAAGKATPEDAVELSLLSQRLGGWIGGDEGPAASRSPLEDPSQLDRLLRVDELKTLSRRDLRILRNTVYARRGRPFNVESMKDYFSGVEWYRADKAYTDKRLTEVDRKNITIILSVEQTLGGPLPEHGKNGEEGWFAEA